MERPGVYSSAELQELDQIVDAICAELGDHPDCAGDKARLRDLVSKHVFAHAADGVQPEEIKNRVIAELR